MPDVDPTMGEPEKPPSRLEQIKYYTSLFLGALAIVCVFGFLFLVPFVLDPAISTMMHQFVEAPVHCRVTRYDLNYGLTNCTWSSCREAPEIFTHSPSFRCDTISSSGSVIQSGQVCVSDL